MLTEEPAAGAELTGEQFAVTANGETVKVTEVVKVATDVDGKTYKLTIDSIDGNVGTLAVNGAEEAFDFQAPEITGVTVKGAKTIVVEFNEKLKESTVKAADFAVQKVTGDVVADSVSSAVLNADGQSVTLVLKDALTVANYAVSVTNKITDVAGNAMITGTEETFKPTAAEIAQVAAPEVIKSTYDVERGELVVTLDKTPTAIDSTKLAINTVALTGADTATFNNNVVTVKLGATSKAAVKALEGELKLKATADAFVNGEDKSVAGEFAIEKLTPATVKTAAYNEETNTLTVTFDQPVKIATEAGIKVGTSTTALATATAATVNGKPIPTDLTKQTAATTWELVLANVTELEKDTVDTSKLKVFLDADAVQLDSKLGNAAVSYADGVAVTYTADETVPTVTKAELFHTAATTAEFKLSFNEKVSIDANTVVTLAVSETESVTAEVSAAVSSANTATFVIDGTNGNPSANPVVLSDFINIA